MEMWQFRQRQSLPYEAKVNHAINVARSFYDKVTGDMGANVHVCVGGLDSLTLLFFLRKYVDPEIKAISVSHLENISIQRIHRAQGIEIVKPLKNKMQVISEFGFPVISKDKAAKIENLQKIDNPKQTFIHAIMTGETGEQGSYKFSKKLKLPDKWIKLFAGNYSEHRPDITCKNAPFKVSDRCCSWLKEKPLETWAAEHNSYSYLGLMAVEGGQREIGLIKNGCNYYGKTRKSVRSCPFAIFLHEDLLRLAIELEVPVPEIYGEIVTGSDGKLTTSGAKRTGCEMCGFGIHLEKRPHRFDRMYFENPKAWEFWMYKCIKREDGTAYGWGEVLDYIGVKWRNPEQYQIQQLKLNI